MGLDLLMIQKLGDDNFAVEGELQEMLKRVVFGITWHWLSLLGLCWSKDVFDE